MTTEHHLPTERRRAGLQAEVRQGFRTRRPGAQENFGVILTDLHLDALPQIATVCRSLQRRLAGTNLGSVPETWIPGGNRYIE